MSRNHNSLWFGIYNKSACGIFISFKIREDVSSQIPGPIPILKLDQEPKNFEGLGTSKALNVID